MKLIDSSCYILTPISDSGKDELRLIETVARTCYKSEANNEGDFEKTKKFVKGLINRGHEAMLEHSILTVKFVCDRGVSHEIVRHRQASFAQESTRYCNYSSDRFGNELIFVKPWWYDEEEERARHFRIDCEEFERTYLRYMNELKVSPQAARAILPNSIKTEIVVTANYREWRHILNLRAANATGPAHPDMNKLMCPLLQMLHENIPVIFDDVYEDMMTDEYVKKFLI